MKGIFNSSSVSKEGSCVVEVSSVFYNSDSHLYEESLPISSVFHVELMQHVRINDYIEA